MEHTISTVCVTCHRAVWAEDVDEDGKCNGCQKLPHAPTEREAEDLGRPEDK